MTIGDIEEQYEFKPEKARKGKAERDQLLTSKAKTNIRRDTSVPKERKDELGMGVDGREENVATQRSVEKGKVGITPAASDYGFTAKLENVSERHSSDFGSHISSFGAGASHISGQILDHSKIKEIRQYVAHAIYRCQKKSDEHFKQFEKLQALRKNLSQTEKRKDLLPSDANRPANKSIKEIDMQYEQVRKQLKLIQAKYDVLKKMRDNLQKLAKNMGYDPVQQ